MKKLSIDFLAQHNLQDYNFDEWFDSAYNEAVRPINRNRTKDKFLDLFDVLRKLDKKKLKTDISKLLKNITKDIKENLFEEISRVSKGHSLSNGVIQKIVSLLMKYIYCYFYANKGNAKNLNLLVEDFNWANNEKILYELHCPIDRYVLKSLRENKSYGLRIKIYSDMTVRTVNGENFPWSRFNEEAYKKVIKEIYRISKNKNISPLELEIRELYKK